MHRQLLQKIGGVIDKVEEERILVVRLKKLWAQVSMGCHFCFTYGAAAEVWVNAMGSIKRGADCSIGSCTCL